jgi:hypothetical protein
MFPGMVSGTVEVHERHFRAWVDYSFMIGAWQFCVGNYLIYFQVINTDSQRQELRIFWRSRALRALPISEQSGYFGSLCNLIGGLFFCVNTMCMFGVDRSSNLKYDIWYVATGSIGSLFFVAGALFEGWHNDFWDATKGLFRRNSLRDSQSFRRQQIGHDSTRHGNGASGALAALDGERNVQSGRASSSDSLRDSSYAPFTFGVICSWINLLGGLLFFIAYAVDWDRLTSSMCFTSADDGGRQDCSAYVWLTCFTFTVGSMCFVVSSWMCLFMWKQQVFGLGFGKTIQGEHHLQVDWRQQAMLAVYCINICFCWLRIGFIAVGADYALDGMWNDGTCVLPEGVQQQHTFNVLEKLFTYHCIMLLASAVHTTPDAHPYDYLLWAMRFIALMGFYGDGSTIYRMASPG